MKCKWLFLCFFMCTVLILNAQIENKNLFPSPNAANLGLYGQIPVDLFTGNPNIDVPIYTFKSRDLSVPIHLSYHAGGIRPSDHGSWVGLGWSLQAGGVITRIQHDMPDEFVDYYNNPAVQRGFFYKYATLNVSNWSAPTPSLANDESYVYPDFYSPITGSMYIVQPERVDFAPDEFQFNFLGMNGTLMMGQDGLWHLKSKEGLNFTVSTEIGPYAIWEPTSTYPSGIRNCLTRFILTSADGTKYYFGADRITYTGAWASGVQYFTSNDTTAIEFGRIGVGTGANNTRDGGTIPVSWYLTKIQSPTGDIITLTYTRDGYQVLVNDKSFGYTSVCDQCPNNYQNATIDDEVTIVDGVTLSGIYGANGSILFNKSKANILDYSTNGNSAFDPSTTNWFNNVIPAYTYEEFSGNITAPKIDVRDLSNNTIKSFGFTYTENTNNRLFLNTMYEMGRDGTKLPSYVFSYNNMAGLAGVPYETQMVDHWGFFNGINPLDPATGIVYPSSNYSLSAYNTFSSMYTNNRAPVLGPMQYGVLTEIDYPTGGNTQFTWEPHYYSEAIDQTPTTSNQPAINIKDLGVSTMGGGLRIKIITSRANFNSPPVTKTYFYNRDYVGGNTVSSGILNSNLPQYVTAYIKTATTNSSPPTVPSRAFQDFAPTNVTYIKFSSENLLPLHYTNGAIFTYTNVAEVNADGGYKIYNYSNHDNGYINTLPAGGLVTGAFSMTNLREFNSNSLELERGLILSEKTYSASSVLLESKYYQYNNDPSRFNNAIRMIAFTRDFAISGSAFSFDNQGIVNVGAPVAYKSDNLFALNLYVHYPYLKSDSIIIYDQNGANPVTVVTNYTYDAYRNKKSETFRSSNGESVTTNFNYAFDAITGLSPTAATGQTSLQTAGMVGLPLEKMVTRGTIQQEHTRLDYQAYQNSNYYNVPLNSYKAVNSNTLESLTQYVNYDSYGNIAEYISRSGVPTSFDWGYNQAYPIVKIENASNTARTTSVQSQGQSVNFLYWNAGVFAAQHIGFTSSFAGNIVLTFGFNEYPGNATVSLNYSLTGPVNQSGTLCIAGSGSSCSPPNITFSNMPAGQYLLTVTPNSNYSISTFATYAYQTTISTSTPSGSKEYFYEGFEEFINSSVVAGNAHTGSRYFGGSTYSPNYSLPPGTTRNFIIQWWSLVGGIWKINEQAYTGSATLTGPVDDIRIFPSDALMSTYTYKPLVGITSEIDANGKTKSYEYDELARLVVVRDQDKNILKKYCYTMAGQTENCTIPSQIPINATNTTSATIILTFTNSSTNVNYSYTLNPNSIVTGTLPAGSYNIGMVPTTYSSLSLINYTVNSSTQTYYAAVTFGGVSITNTCMISTTAVPPVSITGTNSIGTPVLLTFINTATNISYLFTVPAGSNSIALGNVPPGTYNVLMAPNTYSASSSNTYLIYSFTQTYYATVEFGGVSITSLCPVIIHK
jgi:YD repeat-containing protein